MKSLVGVAIACTCSLPTVAAQSGWSLRTTPQPPPRAWHLLAYDFGRSVTVMFSGMAAPDDTWEWNGTTWNARQLSTRPPARSGAAFGYDFLRQRIVMFGGLAASYLGDTWEYDGTNWTQRVVSGPSARLMSGMTYDPVGSRMLLFGGGSGNGTLNVFDDTWSWDGTTWRRLAPAHVPAARWAFGLATDMFRQRIVLHGGSSDLLGANATRTDTWVWTGSDWIRLVTNSGPRPVLEFGFAFDWSRGVMVMFGGDPLVGFTSDTWLLLDDVWIRDPVPQSPALRTACPLAYDVARRSIVMFGGWDGAAIADTWSYTVPAVGRWDPYGAGCAGSAGVPRL